MFNRPYSRRAVDAFFVGMLLLLVGCQPGPPPTPTLRPDLDYTVTPTWQSPTPSATPIPSLTASLPPTLTALPTATPTASPELTPSEESTLPPELVEPAVTLWVTIPPPLVVATAQAPGPAAIPPAQSVQDPAGPSPIPERPADLPQAPVNPGFEDAAVEQGASEVVVPLGWSAWWRTGPVDCAIYEALETTGSCPASDAPDLVYKRPEFSVIPAEGRWLDPPRVIGAGQGARFFCTYGICEGGYFQQVQVQPGQAYVLSAQVHAWCSQNTQDPYRSQLGTRDDQLNCELAVGLDPTGGTDPRSPAVVWGAIYAYDTFQPASTPPVRAQTSIMTLYLKGRSLWALRHNDFHFDQVTFEAD
ncbi:MAG: hypothetical protein JXN59_10740 [Anaerolineae bacterium]|nr:hypothetical protein [Anaerolineae bacterium]